jgi:S1-C subfamily serine protease
MRQRQLKTLEVTIEEQPADFGSTPAPRESRFSPPEPPRASLVPPDKLGLEVADLTADTAEKLGFPPKTVGALIVNVESDSAAGRAGLKRGHVITKVDKQAIRSAADLRGVLDATALEGGILVQVRMAQGETSYVLLRKN